MVRVLRTGREGNFKEWRTFSELLDSESGGSRNINSARTTVVRQDYSGWTE